MNRLLDSDHLTSVVDSHVRFFSHSREFSSGRTLCKLYKINQNWGSIREHTHDYFQIWYIHKGRIVHEINQKEYVMVKGDLCVIPPYVVHRVVMSPTINTLIIGCEFLPDFLNEKYKTVSHQFGNAHSASTNNPFIPRIHLAGSQEQEIWKMFEDMHKEYHHAKPYFENMIKGSLLRLLATISRIHQHSHNIYETEYQLEKYRLTIEKVISYIDEHFHEEIRLEQLCKIAGMSRTYLCNRFKSITGKTFNEYLIELRISKGMDLLNRTELSITDVSISCGFNDLSYFSTLFKKYTGTTPSDYKKNLMPSC